MKAIVRNKIGPYDGPYEKNITTYKLEVADQKIVVWHENGKRGLDANKGDIIIGLELTPDGIPNYSASDPKVVQLKLFL